jgi:hypothetical protein
VSDRLYIAHCIKHCASRKDGRGRWRHGDALMRQLERNGTPFLIARGTAQAAERFSAWLHDAAEKAKAKA